MPYQLQPYNYVSMFQPADLGVVQRGLEQRQGRYDAANQAWAETKNALYSDPTYDPIEKERVIKAVEGNFDNVYKTYQGDLGAATGDLMQMIGGIRKDPYFSLNQIALQKQKEFDALRQQYGAQGLVFSPMKKGLRDEEGNLRKQEDFNYDIVKDLERDEKLASIIDQSLKEVSVEGPLGGGSGVPGLLMSVTKGGKGYQQNKNESIYNEYKNTPEGKLHLRILKEHPEMRSQTPEADLKLYVDQMIANRTAPPSVRRDYQVDPGFKLEATKKKGTEFYPRRPVLNTVKEDEKLFKDVNDVFKAISKTGTTESKIAQQILSTIENSERGKFLRGMVANAAKENGLDPNNVLNKIGFITTPDAETKKQSNWGYASSIAGPVFTNTQSKDVQRMVEQSTIGVDKNTLQGKSLLKYIDNYNNFLKDEINRATDYPNFKWNDFDLATAYDVGGDKLATDIERRSKRTTAVVQGMPMDSWTFETGNFAGKEIKDSDRKLWTTGIEKSYVGGDPIRGNFAVGSTLKDGTFHIQRPKSLDQALTVARVAKDDDARYAAVADFVKFVPGSIVVMNDGNFKEIKFKGKPKIDITKDQYGMYNVVDNGKKVNFAYGNGTPYEVALYLQQQQYIDIPEFRDELIFQ